MLPGPTMVKQCPRCGDLFVELTLASGNTFGAVWWTDGKEEAPMLPDLPRFVGCPYCPALLWLEDLETVGEVDPFMENGPFSHVAVYRRLEARALARAADTGACGEDPSRHLYLRVRAWWASNDRFRQTGRARPRSREATQNLVHLFELLDERKSADQRLMKAEVARELGRFDETERLLASKVPKPYALAADTIRNLARHGNSVVAELRVE